jgi:hypothetical protein
MAKRTKKIAPISVETVEAFEIISATAELDAGDFDKQPQSDRNLDEIAEALEAEDRDDDRSFGEDLAEPFILDADTITFRIHPTEAEMRRVLASIDPAMESAVTAGVVDHESQSASWIPEEPPRKSSSTRSSPSSPSSGRPRILRPLRVETA